MDAPASVLPVSRKRPDGVTLLLGGMALIAFLCLTQDTLRFWWWEWTRPESHYEHGVFAIPCALLVLWYRGKEAPTHAGQAVFLAPLLLGIVLVLASTSLLLRSVQSASLLLMLAGIGGFLLGGHAFRAAVLPALAVLFLAVPLPGPLLNDTTAGLQTFSSACATGILSLFVGGDATRAGNIITLPNFVLEVAAPCSGLQTLMMATLLALVLALLSDMKTNRAVLFFAMALPVALGANIFRIVVTGLVGNFGTPDLAHQAHDGSGVIGLAACAGLLYLLLRRFGCNRLAGQPLS